MIFKQIPEVLDGNKTQTRRLVREDESATKRGQLSRHTGNVVPLFEAVYTPRGFRRFYVGQKLPITPGRGQPAVRVDGVIQYVEIQLIWQERLQQMSPNDAICEGLWEREVPPDFRTWCYTTSIWEPSGDCFTSPIEAYARLWDSINTKKGTRWEDNPLVWVISFQRWWDDAS